MNVQALRHAGLTGLANRGLQVVSRAVDRLAVTAGTPRFAHLRPQPLDDSDPRGDAFFAGASADPGPSIGNAERMRLLTAAERVLAGRFDLLGYEGLTFGSPPDWHLDAVSGRRAPLVHWSLLDPLDHGSLGDHKVIWEINRHQWLVTLAQAWRLTGDARFADAVAAHLDDWMANNPPGMGINWASSLEVSYRLISWCWVMNLLRGAPGFDRARRKRMMPWLRAHALHVERYLSYYYSPNTHLTGEALGLFCAGTTLAALPGARRWRKLGAAILDAEAARQIRNDGTYFEQAACYQRYTAEIYLHYLVLAARNGVEVPSAVTARVQALLDGLLWQTGPDGRLVRTGDDDGGTLLCVDRRETDDARGVFAVAAAWFGRSDYAWAARGYQPEVAWLLGPDGVAAFDKVVPAAPACRPARAFLDGGLVVMRDEWSDTAHQVVLDAGPLGCPVSGGHGHADLLAVHCHAFGKPLVIDPGTGSYVPSTEWRDWFRSSHAHSTVTVGGRPQAEPDGPFGWRTRPAARIDAWHSCDAYDLVDASHDAYRDNDEPATHRRRVVFLRRIGAWLVVDDVAGDGHGVASCLQFAPQVRVASADSDGWVAARLGANECVRVKAFSSTPVRARIEERWFSPAYGARLRAPAAVYEWNARATARVVLLFAPEGVVVRSWRNDGETHEFDFDGACVSIGDRIVVTTEG